MPDGENDTLQKIQIYRELVEKYETLDAEIDALLAKNSGSSKNMSDEDRDHLRKLAWERAETLNHMRILEEQLKIDTDDN
ncbi:MAG: hypothetical protein D6737_11320 [Chloroflexi bacterium]|nr:MAG: hypothetical protein D6737_11320 [Chloroflexota bacterium]